MRYTMPMQNVIPFTNVSLLCSHYEIFFGSSLNSFKQCFSLTGQNSYVILADNTKVPTIT